MQTYSIDELLEMAIQTERLGRQFYEEMAEKFKDNAELSEFFALMARKEQAHERVFEDLKSKVGHRDVEDIEEVSHYMRAMVESEFFIGSFKCLPSMDHVKTVRDAVEMALCFEKDTLLFFHGLKAVVREADAVQAIIDEEQRHITDLSRYKDQH